MCKHCERLVEDADAKDIVHKFMARAAENINRDHPNNLPVTANDLKLTFTWEAQPMNGTQRVARLLDEMNR